jgi:hypothetical protein
MLAAHGPVLGILRRESVAADIHFAVFPCFCVVARDGRGTVTGVGCCTDEHADLLRSFLTPGTFRSRHRLGFSFQVRTH